MGEIKAVQEARGTSKGGKFYHKLIMSLLIASSIFALLSLVILVIVLNQTTIVERQANNQTFISQLNTLNIAQLSLSQILDSVDTYYLDSWLDLPEFDSFRYYYALKLYSWLSSNMGSLGEIAYSLALISNSSSNMVITPTGTSDLDYYLATYCNLQEHDVYTLKQMIAEKEVGITSFSVFNDEALTDVYFAIPYFSENGNNMVFLVRFYISRFFNIADGELAFFANSDGVLILNTNQTDDKILDNIFLYLRTRDSELISHDGYQYSPLANPQWVYISYFEPKNKIPAYLAIWLSLLIAYSIIIYFIVFKQAKRLYSPLSEVIANGIPDITIDRNTDEIELLNKKNDEYIALSNELTKVNEELLHYIAISNNRHLIEDKNISNEESDKEQYSIAIIKFNEDMNISGTILAFQLLLQAREKEGIGYVPYFNRFVLIVKASDMELAKEIVLDLLHELPEDIDVTAVVSNIVGGSGRIIEGYKECLRLLDYSSVLHSSRIITPIDIQNLKENGNFAYSAEDEMFLLKLVLSGNPQAKDELNEILSRNRDGLSLDARYNLATCLFATLMRIFAELKSSPNEIIGYQISFDALKTDSSVDGMINRIRDIFYDVIDNICCSISQSDKQILALMKSYIHENYKNNIGLQNLADKFNKTPKYCGMLFARLSNDNFKSYLNKYRIQEAKRIVENNPQIQVQELAQEVGFNSSTSFIRVFVKYVGVTPKAFADSIAFQKN